MFSKHAFKQLGGILNTTNDTCYLQRLEREIALDLNPTKLYLLDVLQLCQPASSSFFTFSPSKNHVLVCDRSRGGNRSSGSHDRESPVENIALTMAQPASSKSSLKDRDTPPCVTCHAACADDVVSQDRCGSSDQLTDDAAAVLDPPVGSDARRCRESFRDDGSDGGHGSGTSESTVHTVKFDDHVPRCPKEGCPKFNWRFNQCRRLNNGANLIKPSSSEPTDAKCSKPSDCELSTSCSSSSTPFAGFSKRADNSHGTSGKLATDRRDGRGSGARSRGPQSDGPQSEPSQRSGRHGSAWPTNSQGIRADDSRRLVTMQSDMGQETQRQNVSSGSDLGFIVLPMGRCSFSKSHSRAARFRSILPGTDGSRSSQLGSETKHAVEMSSYHAAVDDTRK